MHQTGENPNVPKNLRATTKNYTVRPRSSAVMRFRGYCLGNKPKIVKYG